MLANSKKQKLSSHSFAIGELGVKIFEDLDIDEKSFIKDCPDFKEIIRFSGYFHDIGKIDLFFQNLLEENIKKSRNDFETLDGTHVNNNKTKLETYKKIKSEDYIRHNELSFVLLEFLIDKNKILKKIGNESVFSYLTYIAYWHHAKIFRKDELTIDRYLKKVLKFNSQEELVKNFNQIIEEITGLYNNYYNKNDNFLEYIKELKISEVDTKFPKFKIKYISDNISINDVDKDDFFQSEAKKSLLRSIIITADRIISKLEKEELEKYVNKEDGYLFSDLLIMIKKNENENYELKNSIEKMLFGFNEKAQTENDIININRNKKQNEIVKKLIEHNKPVILSGPAGCGKTKIFLEWIKEKNEKNNESKQVFIIAPRNMICKGLYNELIGKYLTNEDIEIYTGENQLRYNKVEKEILEDEQFKSKIVITTIDQIINIILSHKKIDILLKLLDSYLIFDEFHEFFNISGVVVLFKELILLKQSMNNSRTLLVSATPNYYFSENILKCEVEKIETFNNTKYEFEFKEIEDVDSMNHCILNNFDLLEEDNNLKNGAIVIYNTATTSQLSSLYNYKVKKENNLNYHSKFNLTDKNKLSKQILNQWGKLFNTSKVLRSGPIIQASLNITTHLMLTEITSAENWCQRIGRINRFADINVKGKLITVYEKLLLNPEAKQLGSVKVLTHLNQLHETVSWCNFIKDKKIENIKNIYEMYEQYHQLPETKESYKKDYCKTLIESFDIFEKNGMFAPYQYNKVKEKKNNKLAQKSIRGSSIYVLPVKYNLSNNEKKWLYKPIDTSQENIDNAISLSFKEIDYDINVIKSKASYQSVFFKGKVTGDKNAIILYDSSIIKTLNEDIVLRKAKEIEFPLIISNIENENPNEDKYYVHYDDFIIGLIDIKKIKSLDEENFITDLINNNDVNFED
jgi:CRISPR-associated endonuclease/helicase Cas3